MTTELRSTVGAEPVDGHPLGLFVGRLDQSSVADVRSSGFEVVDRSGRGWFHGLEVDVEPRDDAVLVLGEDREGRTHGDERVLRDPQTGTFHAEIEPEEVAGLRVTEKRHTTGSSSVEVFGPALDDGELTPLVDFAPYPGLRGGTCWTTRAGDSVSGSVVWVRAVASVAEEPVDVLYTTDDHAWVTARLNGPFRSRGKRVVDGRFAGAYRDRVGLWVRRSELTAVLPYVLRLLPGLPDVLLRGTFGRYGDTWYPDDPTNASMLDVAQSDRMVQRVSPIPSSPTERWVRSSVPIPSGAGPIERRTVVSPILVAGAEAELADPWLAMNGRDVLLASSLSPLPAAADGFDRSPVQFGDRVVSRVRTFEVAESR